MKFKITKNLSLALSSDKTTLYVIELPQEGGDGCSPTNVPFNEFSLATGVTIRVIKELEETTSTRKEDGDGDNVTVTTTTEYASILVIDNGKLPATMPAKAFTYNVDFTNGGWVDIQFDCDTNSLAAILVNSPIPAKGEAGISPCNFITSDVTTNLYTVDLSAEKYVQIASTGTIITLSTP